MPDVVITVGVLVLTNGVGGKELVKDNVRVMGNTDIGLFMNYFFHDGKESVTLCLVNLLLNIYFPKASLH